jgi:penicillin-binding protein 1A
MMAKEPKREDYKAAWMAQKYCDDSIQWAENPLYGWCNKNKKPDGTYYDIYRDGLKIYTTIDSRMQKYAEEAVAEHLGTDLQPAFFKEKAGKSYAPFSKVLSQAKVDELLQTTMRRSERYRQMKKAGYSETQIDSAFNTKVPMRVFSWKNPNLDTVMTPLDSIRYLKYFLRCGFMSMDPATGYVKAYVGGPNYNYFQYDMVTSGRRQVGSTMKPFLYTLAMNEGLTPCSEVKNVQQTLIGEDGKPWTPRNASRDRVGEMVSIRWGLATSNNNVTAYLMSQFKPQVFVDLLKSFGIRSKLDPVVSLALGPADISVKEMVSAYTAFVNKGVRVTPVYVERIEDSKGNVISNFSTERNEVFSEETAYKMLDMLNTVSRSGTATRLRYRYQFKGPIGAKTGTTQNNSDGWFMGFTPQLVSGCWVGGEERNIHFDNMNEGQGAQMALPIWALFMKKVYANKDLGYSEERQFDVPKDFSPCGNGVKQPAKDPFFNGFDNY